MTDGAIENEAQLLEALLTCEQQVWEALRNGDAAADAAALSSGFLGVYPDGFAGKEEHVSQLAAGPSIDSFSIRKARAIRLGPDCGVLSYLARYRRCGSAKDEFMYVSSIWQREGPRWINILSQDTPAKHSGFAQEECG